MSSTESPAIGIVCGGGPAPGMNGVIAAATIEARNNGLRVVGFLQGFKHMMTLGADNDKVMDLHIRDVSRIHFQGGSILRTARANPTKDPKHMDNTVACLRRYNVKYLITIGGDDTAFSSMAVSRATHGEIRVCHVPKTIDNDLPLPAGLPTFGYQTAREFGTEVIRHLMDDAKTAPRYFIVVAMGRQAGHLALGIGKSAGAHLTIIPEEFQRADGTMAPVTFKSVCDTIEGTVLKRKAMGKDHGVVVLAEGLIEHMPQQDIVDLFGKENVKFDDHGHILLAELEIGRAVRDELRKRVPSAAFNEKTLGYELRCAPPNAFDREYTRDLGYGAVKYLLGGGSGALITAQGGKIVPLSFEELKDPKTGKTRVRPVDVDGEGFSVALAYMVRLKKSDFEDEEMLSKLAKSANLSTEQFRERFEHLVKENSRL